MNYKAKRYLMLASVTLLLTSTPWQAQALSISVYNVTTQQGLINTWITNLGGQKTIIEDFESETKGWYGEDELVTNVGTFGLTDNSLPGTGTSSYKSKTGGTGTFFELRDYNADGRFNTTPDGHNYLDSADITELSLSLITNTYNNLFFYMTDPSDVKAKTTTTVSTTSESINYKQNNGSLWFVGIDAGDDYISQIIWSTTYGDSGYTNDGFGLDDFGKVAPVPEPATTLLIGIGIAGLTGIARRKRK